MIIAQTTSIIFSVDYKGHGHILSVKDQDWIDTELLIAPQMDDNGIGLPTDIESGMYSADLTFWPGRGWLNGDVYDEESMDLNNVKLLMKAL